MLENTVLPTALVIFAPNLDFVVVAACRDHRLILGVGPCDLPHCAFVRLKCLELLLDAVLLDGCNLDEAVSVAGSELGPIKVVLAVVYIFFVLGFECEDCRRIG